MCEEYADGTKELFVAGPLGGTVKICSLDRFRDAAEAGTFSSKQLCDFSDQVPGDVVVRFSRAFPFAVNTQSDSGSTVLHHIVSNLSNDLTQLQRWLEPEETSWFPSPDWRNGHQRHLAQ